MRKKCDLCGIFNFVNEDGICPDCEQEKLDEQEREEEPTDELPED